MYSYFLTCDAKEDLWRIYQFGVNRFGETQSDNYLMMLHDCFGKIAANPTLFPKAAFIKEDIRYCVCGVDTIYYRIKNKNKIEIITLIGRQDFPK